MIIEISVAVIAFFIVVFVIGLLIALVQIRRTAKEAEKFLDTARQHIGPISHDLTIIFNDVKRITQSIQLQVTKLEKGVDELKQIATRINEFEKMVQEKIEQPIMAIVSLIASLTRPIRALLDRRKDT
ncbi:MAG: DUF948 domain-containing protein [candidate division KSB1 bacterium]|nr:DUF948 domain-containing protein [candidate division KSB1 bacterium]MDZ7333959.1 DUF948 domain-containing protein [candidate division KSB1 bacterium]MDZ7356755.1 DUF948 domain-containing protein [candidate division KSB1 bacterium]MDZ7375377.1 DUF948 domain-containing protein [candidate division KSB1 bacterium]MDZ7399944.1 DUF948 domain-containing protein [candidate division KSB1 bacterium]